MVANGMKTLNVTHAVTPAPPIAAGLWPVADTYERVRVGEREMVRAKPTAEYRNIEPSNEKGLVFQFAGVRNGNTLIEFCQRFGLLGYNRLVPTEKRCVMPFKLPYIDEKGLAKINHIELACEPVKWAVGHADRVNAMLALLDLMKKGAAAVRAELPNLLSSIDFELVPLEKLASVSGRRGAWRADADWPHDPVRVAWSVIRDLINPVLDGLHVELIEGYSAPVLTFDALLQVIYLKLIGQLEDLYLLRCQYGHLFLSTRDDAKTCSAKCRVKRLREKRSRAARRRRNRRGK
jgi:hypothetical protein